MNYEQKYKEALEAATRIYNASEVKITTQKLLEQVFPELKESEDERIRKGILAFIKSFAGTQELPTKEYSKWVEYLEKQKEQEEPQVYKTRDGETITYSETDGYKVCDEKQKEQNYIPSREMILGIWELGNFWKENPEARDGLTQLQYIQKYWNENSYY